MHSNKQRCGIIAVRVKGTRRPENAALAIAPRDAEAEAAAAKNRALDDPTACPGAAAAAAAAPTLLEQLKELGGDVDAAGKKNQPVAAGAMNADKVDLDKRQYDILFGLEILPAEIVAKLDEANPMYQETYEIRKKNPAAVDDDEDESDGYDIEDVPAPARGSRAHKRRREAADHDFLVDDDDLIDNRKRGKGKRKGSDDFDNIPAIIIHGKRQSRPSARATEAKANEAAAAAALAADEEADEMSDGWVEEDFEPENDEPVKPASKAASVEPNRKHIVDDGDY